MFHYICARWFPRMLSEYLERQQMVVSHQYFDRLNEHLSAMNAFYDTGISKLAEWLQKRIYQNGAYVEE